MLLPVGQVVVVVFRQALPEKVAVAQVTGLEVAVVQPFDELDARRAAEAAGAAGRHRLGRVLRPCGLAPLVAGARGGRGVARLEPRAGLAVAPGERRGAVGQAGHAAGVGVVAVVAHVAAVHAAEGRQGKGQRGLYSDAVVQKRQKSSEGENVLSSHSFRETHSDIEFPMPQIEQSCRMVFRGLKLKTWPL